MTSHDTYYDLAVDRRYEELRGSDVDPDPDLATAAIDLAGWELDVFALKDWPEEDLGALQKDVDRLKRAVDAILPTFLRAVS